MDCGAFYAAFVSQLEELNDASDKNKSDGKASHSK
jgi:hypothetical protein